MLADPELGYASEKEKCVHVFRLKNRWGHIAECLAIQNLGPRFGVPKFEKKKPTNVHFIFSVRSK